jgi:NADPH-dependent 2,4-dienoyl-CoA reductase/sulfur reductase-like enzyme
MNSFFGSPRSQRFGGSYSTKWIGGCVVVVSWFFIVACGVSVQAQQSAEWVIRRDVVVYGGTSSGVVCAVAAARQGKTVVLIEPTQFLGGLTTGGLGFHESFIAESTPITKIPIDGHRRHEEITSKVGP